MSDIAMFHQPCSLVYHPTSHGIGCNANLLTRDEVNHATTYSIKKTKKAFAANAK